METVKDQNNTVISCSPMKDYTDIVQISKESRKHNDDLAWTILPQQEQEDKQKIMTRKPKQHRVKMKFNTPIEVTI